MKIGRKTIMTLALLSSAALVGSSLLADDAAPATGSSTPAAAPAKAKGKRSHHKGHHMHKKGGSKPADAPK